MPGGVEEWRRVRPREFSGFNAINQLFILIDVD